MDVTADALCFASARDLAQPDPIAPGVGPRSDDRVPRADRPPQSRSQRHRRQAGRRGVSRAGRRGRSRARATADRSGRCTACRPRSRISNRRSGFRRARARRSSRHFMPDADSVLVERIRRAGAIPIGKTNVPEFGMGSQTYNKVYGTTRQSVRSHEDRGRIERRRGGGAGGRHAADRRRRRSRRLAAQSRQLQQHRRAPAERRPGAGGADADSVRRRVDERRDGAIGRRTWRLA